MLWIVPAVLAALFASLQDVFSKKGLKDIDEYIVSWALRFFALPFLLPLLLFIEIPQLGPLFWTALLVNGLLIVVATILYMKAIKHSDLSLTIPMITFTPLFLLITSPLLIGEFPAFSGVIGVFLIVLGSYVLNIKERHNGFLAPFRALLKEKGPKLMLAVAFIYSITSNFDKIGIQNSSPIFWTIAVNIFIMLAMLPIMICKSKGCLRQIPMNYKALLPIGLFSAMALAAQMTAINLTLVAYVISVKRTGIIFGVLFGHFIFKEKGVKERLLGAAIMVLGVVLIAFS